MSNPIRPQHQMQENKPMLVLPWPQQAGARSGYYETPLLGIKVAATATKKTRGKAPKTPNQRAHETPITKINRVIRLDQQFKNEIPNSVVSVGAPQAALASSIHCSENWVSVGLGNCLASLGNFLVGSLPVNPGPSIEGGLDAGAPPLASSSPPRQCEP
ncbi:hypothetical protein Nepgr_002656 [Nepenthes gracilis]|uniref:Uncharacterized protein n=1 Tax=Nepenthes gracilis TaxID=150966 RepID=A0AAD3PA77_NEPGR|nr:hypothetical protein Nepgr_002656 [Nepenthes gracilis]